MCGRYNLSATPDALEAFYDELGGFYRPWTARYNIAPGQNVPVIVMHHGARVLTEMHWGLIPHWAKDRRIGYRMINARSETVFEKPAFRTLIRQSRCLIPATGWYEWQQGADGHKQPFHIQLPAQQPFAFAGLWTRWQAADGEAINSCSILTTQAHADIAQLLERMPIAFTAVQQPDWLNPAVTEAGEIRTLMVSTQAHYTAYPVSSYVNKTANGGQDCIVGV